MFGAALGLLLNILVCVVIAFASHQVMSSNRALSLSLALLLNLPLNQFNSMTIKLNCNIKNNLI